ncbi:hypothetical protein V2J09_023656 [Rumex salicifolius]
MKGNKLGGPMPSTLCNLSSLVHLDLSRNSINGHIPACNGTLKNLLFMQLQHNNLKGHIPNEISTFSSLSSGTGKPTFISHGYDDYTGYTTFYNTGGTVFQMSELDLSGNQLSGDIPPGLGYLKGLHGLNLSHNNLIGLIPKSFSNLRSIESLDLSNNSLRGEIPSELVSLTSLEVFNVSYNNLSGSVPTTKQFGTFCIYSYQGNPFLHGYQQCLGSGIGKPPIASFGEEDEERSEFDWVVFFWSFGAAYSTILLAFIGGVVHQSSVA